LGTSVAGTADSRNTADSPGPMVVHAASVPDANGTRASEAAKD
jgi:hypothetical protein